MTNTQTPPSTTTVVNTTGEPVTNIVANYSKRPEKFNGQNFKRWQQKMFSILPPWALRGMTLSETFQAVAIIEKLPPSWVDFKNYLKHKRKEMSVEDLAVRLRIEEGNRSNPKGKGKDKRKNDKKSKGKSKYLAPKAGIVKQKFQGTCYNCDQPGHRAASCMMPKRVNPRHENMVNDDVDIIMMVFNVCAMIYEVNLVAVDNGQKLYMRNYATTDIKGEGDVFLKMTSEKELKLTNVLYVLEIRKNLVFGWLLNKFGFRLVFESDKFVLSKNQMYVGRVYAMNDKNIKVVRIDRRGEYVSPFVELCAKYGIRHEFTATYSPQQNGIAERKNRTLKEMVTAMLINSGMSQDKWGKAILTATYLLNKIPCKEKEETPYELWMGRKPSYQKTGSSSRLDDEVFHDKRQQDENDLQVKRQNQVEEVRNRYKWIFKKKMKADGTIDKYKARLVIKGFRQREGLDYFDTYSTVTRITSIRMILAISALRNLKVHQMDMKTAFLNGDLEEEIYMNQPEGFIAPGQEGKIGALRSPHRELRNKLKLVMLPQLRAREVKVINRVLHYLRYTRDYTLHYDRHPAVIEGYSDPNWISDIKDSRSTGGYVFTL
uniref:Zinc finger, CCHC-type n=1 Tax=Tanacetum cinerariifolium TaxID=118510 RepID=A0A699HIK0_TANCI|nr:hypothetical protein [Tanacetum cinerariifolium]